MAIHEIMNPILNPLLTLNPFYTILIISLIVSIITTLIYKYTTNQTLLKEIKTETKKMQDKLKLSSKNPEKALKIQQDMMKLNMEYMKSSFKPMFFTFIPIILFFGWLGANLAYEPLSPDMSFSINVTLKNINGDVSLILPENFTMNDEISKQAKENIEWKNIKATEGEHRLKLIHDESGEEYYFDVLISNKQQYLSPINKPKSDVFDIVLINQKKLLIFEDIMVLKNIPWIKGFGWLGAYILFSLVFSTALRKSMKLS